jgi:hypothetical protein
MLLGKHLDATQEILGHEPRPWCDREHGGREHPSGADSYTLEVITLAVIYLASGGKVARQIAGRLGLLIKQ